MTKKDILVEIIKEQTNFVYSQAFVLMFLEVYQNNKKDFYLLIGDDILDYYAFPKEDDMNEEYLWESLAELCEDIVNKNKNFKLVGNGLFATLHFSGNKKKKSSEVEIFEYFVKFSESPWEI